MEKNLKTTNKESWISLCIAVGVIAGAIQMLQIAVNGIVDSDYYWHITLGRWILEHKTIFREDVFSWIAAERGYVETAHSWLGSVVISLFAGITADPTVGAGIFAGFSTVITASLMAYAWVSPLSKENEKCDFLNGILTIAAGLTVVMQGATPRPLNFGILLFCLSMLLLHDGFERPESKKCWWIPFLGVLWANLHGGSVPILFAFIALFLVLSCLPAFSIRGVGQVSERSKTRIIRFGSLLMASAGAALINPYGYKLFIYFFYTNNEATKRHISEWQPAVLINPTIYITIAILLLILMLRREKRTVELSYLLPVLATLYMTGKYIRIKPYVQICDVILVSHFLRITYGDYEPKKLNSMPIRRIAALLMAVSLVLLGGGAYVTVNPIEASDKDRDPINVELMTVLDQLEPERMYTTYDDGGYLIYHGYQSFVDSRADLFPGDMLEKAITFDDLIGFSSDELDEFITEYQFDAILLKHDSPLSAWLTINPNWSPVFIDDGHDLFVPRP